MIPNENELAKTVVVTKNHWNIVPDFDLRSFVNYESLYRDDASDKGNFLVQQGGKGAQYHSGSEDQPLSLNMRLGQ